MEKEAFLWCNFSIDQLGHANQPNLDPLVKT